MTEVLELHRLTAMRTVMLGAGWNAAGRLLPMLIALAATPRLIVLLGIDRWGVFTLALSLVGMFGLFDLGIGRALTRSVAAQLGAAEPDRGAAIAWTGLLLISGLGVLGGLVLAASIRPLVDHVLAMPEALRAEVARALYMLCLAVPLAVVNAGLWGILAACQSFRDANLVNLPVMAGYYLGPLLILPAIDDLGAVIAVLVLCRLAMTLAYWQLCLKALPALRCTRIAPGAIALLLRQGGWMTVSNLAQPAMLYLDRFVVASMLSVGAAAYYATPYDLLTRAWVIPVAIMNAVFPAISASFAREPATAIRLYRRAILTITLLLLPPCLALVLAGGFGLRIWLGPEFAAGAGPVLQWLAVGLVFNCVAFVPVGLLDGVGRPDVGAKCAAAEAVLYVPLLLLSIHLRGIEGAAIAWSARSAGDCAVRLGLAAWYFPPARAGLGRLLILLGLTGTILAITTASKEGVLF